LLNPRNADARLGGDDHRIECAASDYARNASAAKRSAQPTSTMQLMVIAARVDTSGSSGT
jgi:hypothetical protein